MANEPFQAVKITDKVYWVGAVDWGVRDFHGYLTSRGTTYNAFLVLSDGITLIDTVKAPFREEMMSRIASLIDPREIRFVVSNHSEMDHSGSLPEVIRAVSPENIYASARGVKALTDHFHLQNKITAVKDGETIAIGGTRYTFLETPMLHWPDSMFCWLPEEGVLFSNDAFGMHLASNHRFADEIEAGLLLWEGAKYYANILLPLSSLVTRLLEKVEAMDLPVKILAPDHGPIWRQDIMRMPELYGRWAAQAPTGKAVVVFDTMWQSTARMAMAIGDGLTEGGAEVKIHPMGSSHRSDVATELLEAGALIVGSPTINNGLFPTIADVLCYLKGLRPQNLVGGAFGSFGWSGEASGEIQEALTGMKVKTESEPLKIRYVPDGAGLIQCRDFGRKIAERLIKSDYCAKSNLP